MIQVIIDKNDPPGAAGYGIIHQQPETNGSRSCIFPAQVLKTGLSGFFEMVISDMIVHPTPPFISVHTEQYKFNFIFRYRKRSNKLIQLLCGFLLRTGDKKMQAFYMEKCLCQRTAGDGEKSGAFSGNTSLPGFFI